MRRVNHYHRQGAESSDARLASSQSLCVCVFYKVLLSSYCRSAGTLSHGLVKVHSGNSVKE